MPYCMYLRKSRADLEAEARGEGETLARHLQTLTLLAARMNLYVPPDAIYREIVSGDTIAARPMMQRLLQEVTDGKWEGVLCTEVERLARGDTIDQGMVANAFKFSGAKIITPQKTYDPGNEMDEEYFEFSLFMARREYKAIKRRMQAGRAASVREGHYVGGKRPFGYEVVKCKGEKGFTLQQIPEEARIVRMVFDMYLQGIGTTSIANRLTALGSTTYNGIEWSTDKVRNMLKQPVYAGFVQWFKRELKPSRNADGGVTQRPFSSRHILVKGQHEPIVSEEDFNSAQMIAASRRKLAQVQKPTIANPLAGLCKCALCGYALTRRPNRAGVFLVCRTPSCKNSSIPFDAALSAVLDGLRAWVDEYSGESPSIAAPAAPNRRDELAAARAALDTARRQLTTAMEMLERRIYTEEEYLQRRAVLQQKITAAQEEISRIESAVPVPDTTAAIVRSLPQIKSILSAWPYAATPSDQNALLRSVLSRIDFQKSGPLRHNQNPRDFLQVFLYPLHTPSDE